MARRRLGLRGAPTDRPYTRRSSFLYRRNIRCVGESSGRHVLHRVLLLSVFVQPSTFRLILADNTKASLRKPLERAAATGLYRYIYPSSSPRFFIAFSLSVSLFFFKTDQHKAFHIILHGSIANKIYSICIHHHHHHHHHHHNHHHNNQWSF